MNVMEYLESLHVPIFSSAYTKPTFNPVFCNKLSYLCLTLCGEPEPNHHSNLSVSLKCGLIREAVRPQIGSALITDEMYGVVNSRD